jgi:hypothetical protein
MNFYVVLGRSNHPISNDIFSEADIEEMKKLPQAIHWSFVPVNAPWERMQWARGGGRGESPYPKGEQQTTIRVPKNIAYQVQQYAVWLSRQGVENKID